VSSVSDPSPPALSIGTIVVPIDGSELSVRAVAPAVAIAEAVEARIRLVTVVADEGELAAGHERLDEGARLVPPSMHPALDVLIDEDPVRTLLGIAAEPGAILCFASHDRTRLSADLLHSIGSHVAARASVPYILVGSHVSPPPAVRDVVVALDGVSAPDRLLATAAAWAARLGGPLRIVTVYEPAPDDVRTPGHYTRRHGPAIDPDVYLTSVQHHVDGAGLTKVEMTSIPDPTSVSAGLEQHLSEHPAYLVVLGPARHDLSPFSVARDLLRGSPPPLLVLGRAE
jgi:nucleotide-binding universal stress UspA family protein